MFKKTLPIISFFIVLVTLVGYTQLNATEPKVESEKVILIHGFVRSKISMWPLYIELCRAGYEVENIGYSSLNKTIDEIKTNVFEQINSVSFKKYKKIHFVGHSLGGLLCRAYLDEHKVENLGNVVLIGTPNNGTELVDTYKKEWWFKYVGPTAKVLGTDEESFPKSLKKPYYPVGVIAGVTTTYMDIIENAFEDEHDGMVSVESTKVEGMIDFIKIETNHSMLRHDNEVALQTIYLLQNRRFLHKKENVDEIK